MGTLTFVASFLRVAVTIAAAGFVGRGPARRLGFQADALGRLAGAVIAVTVVSVAAELLGLFGACAQGRCLCCWLRLLW